MLDAISYNGPEYTVLYITMATGYTHRVKVWWGETVNSLESKINTRPGHGSYHVELWQSQYMHEGRQEIQMLLEVGNERETRVRKMWLPFREKNMWLKVSDWMNEELNYMDYRTREDEEREEREEAERNNLKDGSDSEPEWPEVEIVE